MRRLLNIFELASLLNVSTMTVRRMWANGTIPPPLRLVKRTIRWDPAVIDKCLADMAAENQTETEKQEA